MNKRAIKTYFNMSAGSYCGLFLEKRLAIRMNKLLIKQQQEIKELLASNIEETEISGWTLAYPNEEQTRVAFFNPHASESDKLKRVELFSKEDMIKKEKEVYKAVSMIDAEKAYLEYHGKLEYLNFTKEATKDEAENE